MVPKRVLTKKNRTAFSVFTPRNWGIKCIFPSGFSSRRQRQFCSHKLVRTMNSNENDYRSQRPSNYLRSSFLRKEICKNSKSEYFFLELTVIFCDSKHFSKEKNFQTSQDFAESRFSSTTFTNYFLLDEIVISSSLSHSTSHLHCDWLSHDY